jgi:hypothetical protein
MLVKSSRGAETKRRKKSRIGLLKGWVKPGLMLLDRIALMVPPQLVL